MQLTGGFGRLDSGKISVILYRPVGTHVRSKRHRSGATLGDCLHLGMSMLLRVESNVPILFIRSVPKRFIKRSVPSLFIHRIVRGEASHSSFIP